MIDVYNAIKETVNAKTMTNEAKIEALYNIAQNFRMDGIDYLKETLKKKSKNTKMN